MGQLHGLFTRRRREPSKKVTANLHRQGNRKGPVKLSVYFTDWLLCSLRVFPDAEGRAFQIDANEFGFDFCNGIKGYDKLVGHPIIQPIDTKGRFSIVVEDVTHWYPRLGKSEEFDVEIVSITPGAGMRFKIIPKTSQK